MRMKKYLGGHSCDGECCCHPQFSLLRTTFKNSHNPTQYQTLVSILELKYSVFLPIRVTGRTEMYTAFSHFAT